MNDAGEVVGVVAMFTENVQSVTGGIDLVDVRSYIKNVIDLYPPSNADEMFLAGQRHFKENRFQIAIDHLTQAIQKDNNHSNAYQLRGWSLMWNGDMTTAAMDFDQAIEINKSNSEAFRGRSKLNELQGKFDEALKDASRAIQKNPNSARAYHQRATIHYKTGRAAESLSDCDKAIGIDPTLHEAFNTRGLVHLATATYDKAVEQFVLACQLNRNAAYSNNVGLAHTQLQNLDLAKQWLEFALQLEPSYAVAMINLGDVYRLAENYSTAIAYLDRGIELSPRSSFGYQTRALCLIAIGDQQAAKIDFDVAIQLTPNSPQLFVQRGLLLDMMGQAEDARKDYDRAIELNPKLAETLRPNATDTKSATVTTKRPQTNVYDWLNGVWRVQETQRGVQYDVAIAFNGDRFEYRISWVDAAGQPGEIGDHGTFYVGKDGHLYLTGIGGVTKRHLAGGQDGTLSIQFPDSQNEFTFHRAG